jgi:hypothetical protein
LPRARIVDHVRLREDGEPVRILGHFKGRIITRSRFAVFVDGALAQFETGRVGVFLAAPKAGWPYAPNKRNGKTGRPRDRERFAEDRRLSDACEREQTATVLRLSKMLGLPHFPNQVGGVL